VSSCWCHAQYDLDVPADSPGGSCWACSRRSPSACKQVHVGREGGRPWSDRAWDATVNPTRRLLFRRMASRACNYRLPAGCRFIGVSAGVAADRARAFIAYEDTLGHVHRIVIHDERLAPLVSAEKAA
jgi:hypothetical protein